jgi:hypothetical protein
MAGTLILAICWSSSFGLDSGNLLKQLSATQLPVGSRGSLKLNGEVVGFLEGVALAFAYLMLEVMLGWRPKMKVSLWRN